MPPDTSPTSTPTGVSVFWRIVPLTFIAGINTAWAVLLGYGLVTLIKCFR
jgi:hypothetical protein